MADYPADQREDCQAQVRELMTLHPIMRMRKVVMERVRVTIVATSSVDMYGILRFISQ